MTSFSFSSPRYTIDITPATALKDADRLIDEGFDSFKRIGGDDVDLLARRYAGEMETLMRERNAGFPGYIREAVADAAYFLAERYSSLGISGRAKLRGPFDCSGGESSGLGDPVTRSFEISFEQAATDNPDCLRALLVHEMSHAAAAVSIRSFKGGEHRTSVGLRHMGRGTNLYLTLEEGAAVHNENSYLLDRGWQEVDGIMVVHHPESRRPEDLLFRACYAALVNDDVDALLSLLAGSDETRNMLSRKGTTELPFLRMTKGDFIYKTKYQCIQPSLKIMGKEIKVFEGVGSFLDLLSVAQVNGSFEEVSQLLQRVYGTNGLVALARLGTHDSIRKETTHRSIREGTTHPETEYLSLYARAFGKRTALQGMIRGTIERLVAVNYRLHILPQSSFEDEVDKFLRKDGLR